MMGLPHCCWFNPHCLNLTAIADGDMIYGDIPFCQSNMGLLENIPFVMVFMFVPIYADLVRAFPSHPPCLMTPAGNLYQIYPMIVVI